MMETAKAHIIAQLQKEILPLQGYKPLAAGSRFDGGLGFIKHAFPNACFPLAAMHEFFCKGIEDISATAGFISGILSHLLHPRSVLIWISASRRIYPPALKSFGILPEHVIFLSLKKEKDILWAMEEALKCEGLTAVVAETPELSFNISRRFQLAVEQSRATGFIIRNNPKNLATACVTRWKVTSLPSASSDGLPGLAFPRWQVELTKVRNGTPGSWQLEWSAGSFNHISAAPVITLNKKTG